MGLSWLQPAYSFPGTGDTQRRDGEHDTEPGNGNHTAVVIELCIAIAMIF